jgi:hypothetical protein
MREDGCTYKNVLNGKRVINENYLERMGSKNELLSFEVASRPFHHSDLHSPKTPQP